ncbi:MAG: C4-type zinc ribbon domain-containing protein [Chloroflexota bacterium]
MVQKLYELQKIDTMWLKVRRRLVQIQKMMGEPDTLKQIRLKIAETEEALSQQQVIQKDSELESQSVAARIQETEKQMMSGEISNPKELETLQESVDALTRQKDMLEERSVEAIFAVENITNALKADKERLATLEAELAAKSAKMKDEENKLKRNFMILKQKRQKFVEDIPEDELGTYEHLRQRKAGIAITTIENESCGTCNVQVPTGVLQRVNSGTSETVYCTSCGRILFAA